MPEAASVALTNPALPGDVPLDTIIYAAAGLVYPAPLSQYAIYSTPDPAYITPRINIAAFANLGGGATWPFASSAVPLNGHVCVPQGRGPFPLVVFAHGNHQPVENSSPGYLYLCRLLASHGIIAATIDVNFLNGGNFGENDGRAIVHLEHLKQFRTLEQHGRSSAARTGGPEPHHDRGPFPGRRGRGARLVLQPAVVDSAGQHQSRGAAGRIGSRTTRTVSLQPERRGCHCAHRRAVSAAYRTYRGARSLLRDSRSATGMLPAFPATILTTARMRWTSPTPPCPAASGKRCSGSTTPITISSTASGLRGGCYATCQPGADCQGASRSPGASGAAAPAGVLCRAGRSCGGNGVVPAGTEFVSQYQGPDRFFVQHHQEGAAPPVVSLPAQGTVFADSVTATRALTALVPGVTTTLTLRLAWSALRRAPPGARGSGHRAGRAVQGAVATRRAIRRCSQSGESRPGLHAGGFERFAHACHSRQFHPPPAVSGGHHRRTEDHDADPAAARPAPDRGRRRSHGPPRDLVRVRPAAGGGRLRRRSAIFHLIRR